MTLYVDVSFGPVDRIHVVCGQAVMAAKRCGMAVRFVFNDETVVAYSESDPDELVASYLRAIEARRCDRCGALDCEASHR